MRLAFIVGQLGLGGAEQQLFYLLSGVDRARLDPHVISLTPQPGEHWERPIDALGVSVCHVRRGSGRGGRVMQIASILRSVRADIVHGWAFHTNPYAAVAGRLAGVPVRLGSMRESYAGLPTSRIWRWAGVRGLDGLITNSRVNAEALGPHVPSRHRVHVVPNGVPLPSETCAAERVALKRQLGLAASDRVVGTVGRLDHNKNHPLLLRAFAQFESRWPDVHVVIIGDGPLRVDVAREAAQLGIASRVHLMGALPGAARYVPAFDVCCLTSHTEGMPNLLMEAAAAGVPAVATDCGGTRDVIEHGVTGYLVAPGDATGLGRHLDQLLASPELGRSVGQAGRARMRREFSIDAMVARMTGVYQAELARRIPAYA